jgi:ElaB/YqjD/DUF883 family membrane-anchored ribosome-binding protein
MSNFAVDTLNKVNGVENDLKNKMVSTGKQLEKISHSAGETIGEAASNFANTTSEYVKSGRQYVVGNPVKGVAFAAAAGLIAGTLFTLALRRR